MRYYQLFENKDYALAKRLFMSLSDKAQQYIKSWEIMNWDEGNLSVAYEKNDPVAQEINQKFEAVREDMRKRYGDTITLYRGIDETDRPVRSGRLLFSWTSSEQIARLFAGNEGNPAKNKINPITDEEIAAALARYEQTGFVSFRGMKYKINKRSPQYYDIYDRHNQYVTDGDNLEREFRRKQDYYDEVIAKRNKVPGRVVKKEIPIDDVVWVLMGGNANEYIVKGHPE
jgi:hypothetical protein